jgi:hypothetical protein
MVAIALATLTAPRASGATCPDFSAAVNYAAGKDPRSVAVGDLNGDGKLDLVVANQDSRNVSVLLGNGDGTFAPAVNYAVGDTPLFVAIADFNGDGKRDLAASDYASSNVSILLGNGNGTLHQLSTSALVPVPYPS